MKKTLTVLAGMFALVIAYGGAVFWLANANVVAADPKVRLYLSPASSSITTGATTTLQIRLSKNTNSKVDYVNANLTFSVKYLEVTSLSKQKSYFSESSGRTTSYSNTKGTISVKGSGADLPNTADVLVGTITFKGKSASTTSVSFTAASQAGDITGGGHVKNELDMKTGATVKVSSPATTTAPTKPTSAPTPTPTPTPKPTPPDATPTPPSPTSTDDSPQYADDVSEEAAALAAAEAEPFWKKYLWPIVGGSVLLGAAAVGGTLALRKRGYGEASVELPPFMPTVIENPMPEEEVIDASELVETDAVITEELPVEQNTETVEVQEVPEEPEEQAETTQPVDTPPPAEAVKPLPPAPQPLPPPVEPLSVATPAVQTLTPAPQQVATPMVASTPATLTPQPQAAAAPQAAVRNTTDYANLPDMFDVGEQRLRDEGLVDMKPTASK